MERKDFYIWKTKTLLVNLVCFTKIIPALKTYLKKS